MAWTLNTLDWSFSDPDDAAFASMAAGGVLAVSRYAWDGDKGLTADEQQRLFAHGLGLAPPNYEADSGFVLGGKAAAKSHCPDALHLSELWAPHCPVVYSIDRDLVTTKDFTTVGNFFDEANTQHQGSGRGVTAYGEIDALQWLRDRGLILPDFSWPTLAWAHGQDPPSWSGIYQFSINNKWSGNAVDFNTIINPAALARYGWFPAGHTLAGGTTHPIDPPSPVEAGMFELIRDTTTGQVFACGIGKWHLVRGQTELAKIRTRPTCANRGVVGDVTHQGALALKQLYVGKND